MKKMKISLCLLLCMIFSILCFSGCSNKSVRKFVYKSPQFYTYVNEEKVAQNDDYTLLYSKDHVISLVENDDDSKVWSSVPDSYLKLTEEQQNGKADLIFRSPVIISYFDEKYEIKTAYAYENVIPENTITTKIIENGIRVIYFFESAQISVPVEYVLHKDGLEARLIVEGIREGDLNRLYSVSLLPGMAAVKNTENQDNYIFVPSGSGTLMYTDAEKRIERKTSMPVYGIDPTESVNEKINNDEECRLPVFGVKERNGGLLTVIDKNAELAYIDVSAGDGVVGYSYIYPTIHVRGTDTINSTDQWGGKKSISIHSEDLVGVKYCSVKYYPLKENESDYVAMAKRYSEILFEDKESIEKINPLNIQFYGGVVAKNQIIGISYDEFVELTNFNNVKEILKQCNNELGFTPNATLTGFGESGVSYGELCGNFTFSKKLGGIKGFNLLKDFCKENGSKLIFDVDTIFFTKGANGILNVAKKVSDLKARYSSYNLVTKRMDSESIKPYILARDELVDVSKELAVFSKERFVDYINLNTLGRIAYSDYRQSSSFCKVNMSADFSEFVKNLSEAQCNITTSDANAYAAKFSACIFDVPLSSSKYDGFDLDVPFYQIVFKGKTAMTTAPLNLSADSRRMLLKAVESGIGINYSVCKNWDSRLARSCNRELSFSNYDGIKKDIIENGKEIVEVCNALQGAEIVGHQNHGKYSVTTFSNRYITVVNYSKTAVQTPYGEVEPQNFILTRREDN